MVLCRSPLGRLVDRKVALFARKPHYRDHLTPIWERLPNDVKWEGAWEQHGNPTLIVAGASDIRYGRPYVYVEHGSGQSYVDVDHPAYSGGHGHEGCILFVCPNNAVRDRWKARYDTPAVVVGSPRLDPYHGGYEPPERTVAITFHWDCRITPETRSAWPHYQDQIYTVVQAWRSQGWTVLGHAHPRIAYTIRKTWERLQVPWTDDPLRDASVLAADNTSLIADFLSCGRPVIALNAPWYRRDIHHGHRFWELDVTYVDTAEEASQIDLSGLSRPLSHPYAFADGGASERAAQAILDLIR